MANQSAKRTQHLSPAVRTLIRNDFESSRKLFRFLSNRPRYDKYMGARFGIALMIAGQQCAIDQARNDGHAELVEYHEAIQEEMECWDLAFQEDLLAGRPLPEAIEAIVKELAALEIGRAHV